MVADNRNGRRYLLNILGSVPITLHAFPHLNPYKNPHFTNGETEAQADYIRGGLRPSLSPEPYSGGE